MHAAAETKQLLQVEPPGTWCKCRVHLHVCTHTVIQCHLSGTVLISSWPLCTKALCQLFHLSLQSLHIHTSKTLCFSQPKVNISLNISLCLSAAAFHTQASLFLVSYLLWFIYVREWIHTMQVLSSLDSWNIKNCMLECIVFPCWTSYFKW